MNVTVGQIAVEKLRKSLENRNSVQLLCRTRTHVLQTQTRSLRGRKLFNSGILGKSDFVLQKKNRFPLAQCDFNLLT